MRYDPSLFVRRMLVTRGSQRAYDETFHLGVNVIRGENSSGKSTILNFLFYGLGGDLTAWSDYALLCDDVYIEAEISGKLVSIRRSVSEKSGQPMEIFPGPLDEGLKNAATWERYPYARSASKESFSQILFAIMGMPQASDDVEANVTMHQILRLIYSDQLSPVDSLFRYEQFDPPSLREAVGNLLTGVFYIEYYQNQLNLKRAQELFDRVSARLSSLFEVLGQIDKERDILWIENEIREANSRRKEVADRIKEAEFRLFNTETETSESLAAQGDVYDRLMLINEQVSDLREHIAKLQFDISDSARFIVDLERRLASMDEASLAMDAVGKIEFRWCPSCYASLEEPATHICHLCKADFEGEAGRSRLANLITSTATQLRQSRALQAGRNRDLSVSRSRFAEVEAEWRRLAAQYDSIKGSPSSDAASELKALEREMGYIERQLEDLARKSEIAEKIKNLISEKESVSSEIDKLKLQNEALFKSQEDRRASAKTAISEKIKYLLTHDLRRQDAFENPDSVWFDFRLNKIGVDDQTYFSASSRTYLRNSFYISFLLASTEMKYFRYPRICIMDTIEDKGMEMERSHNFQNLILHLSSKANVDHQIIFATAMVSPELEDDAFAVGKRSTRDSPTLSIA